MKILFFNFILIFSFNVLGETYFCTYKELGNIKNISFDRITHSHFKKCNNNQCDDKKYSAIFADNDSLIIGDVIEDEKKGSNFLLFIIDKNTKLFSASIIQFPNNITENKFFNGECVRD